MEPIKYRVLNGEGKEVGTVDLDPEVFGAKISEHLVHEVVTWQRNRKRAGTHSTLSKGVMKGGNKKPWRQKGTGRARAGSNTSPVWVGGAVAHGPKPHDYETRVSKRARRQALLSVLSDKVAQKTLVVIDGLSLESGKTKDARKVVSNLGLGKAKVAIVFPKSFADAEKTAEWRATRNLANCELFGLDGINTMSLLRSRYLLCTIDGVSALQSWVKGRSAV